MHDYLFSTEVVRFAFMFGVAVSMLLYERRHLTTGSIVVPGYIATFLVYPLIVVATFLNALLSYVIVNKLLRRWFLLYGRTKFTVLAMVSIVIQTAMLKLTPSGPWLWESDFKLFVGVGYVVPALVAHDMGRQGIKKTIKSVMLAAGIVAVPITLALAVNLPGINDLAPLQGGGDMAITPGWIPFAVLLSAAAAWGVAHNYQYRSGGFVGAAFIAMLLGDPWQVLIAALVALVTYLIVTRFLMNSMILFGRRKFSAMLLVSSSLAWSLLWMGAELFDSALQSHLDLGSLALTPLFVPGLLANDMQRTSPRRVLFGLAFATTFVLSTTWWVQSLFEGLELPLFWKLISLGSFAAIFWRQFVPAHTPVPARMPAPKHAPATTSSIIATAATFGRSGYLRWAAIHRDAADAAERWLTSILGEPLTPALAPAVNTTVTTTVTTTIVETLTIERTTERLRAAAVRALNAPASPALQPAVTNPAAPPLPRRRAANTTRGEFDTVASTIAAGVGRPQPLPRRTLDPDLDTETMAPTTRSALQAARVLPDAAIRVDQQAGLSGAAAERAQTAAPDTRDTDSHRKETTPSVFPG
jgi:poly-gamma-glutamate biosynthesis protein PgsC/CapC